MRTVFCHGVRFLNARVTPDGRLAVAIAAQYGVGDIRVYMGLMRLEEFSTEIVLGRSFRDFLDYPYQTYPRKDDYEVKFELRGELDAYQECDFEAYADEAWRRDYDERREIEAAPKMLEDLR